MADQWSVIAIDLERHKLLGAAAAVCGHGWRFGDGVPNVSFCQGQSVWPWSSPALSATYRGGSWPAGTVSQCLGVGRSGWGEVRGDWYRGLCGIRPNSDGF